MTQKNREKLIFVTGMLEGIAFVMSDVSLGEALDSVREQIENVLKEDAHENA